MQVNITLIAQACNFFVAWFLLHRLFFRPAIAVLDAQQGERDAALLQKDQWHVSIAEKEQELHTSWRKLKHFSRQYMPGESVINVLKKQEDVSLPHDDAVDRAALVQQLKETICAEVFHADI